MLRTGLALGTYMTIEKRLFRRFCYFLLLLEKSDGARLVNSGLLFFCLSLRWAGGGGGDKGGRVEIKRKGGDQGGG